MPRKPTKRAKRAPKPIKYTIRAAPEHPLRAYMLAHGISYRMAMEQLDATNLHHVCARSQRPGAGLAQRIVKWTKGEVTFEDLYGEAK